MLRRAGLVLGLLVGLATAQAADVRVGMSVSVGEPGFYGRLDIGDYPPPVLLYPTPVVIRAAPVVEPPLYLYVPPGHARRWAKYCARYDACGRPVYFVQDSWYQQVYVPHYKERFNGRGGVPREHDVGRGHDDDHGHGRGSERGRR